MNHSPAHVIVDLAIDAGWAVAVTGILITFMVMSLFVKENEDGYRR